MPFPQNERGTFTDYTYNYNLVHHLCSYVDAVPNVVVISVELDERIVTYIDSK